MKKVLLALLTLVVATSVSMAGVGIMWTTAMIGYTHDASNLTEYPTTSGLLQNYSAIWQLIYAGADNIANPINQGSGNTADPLNNYLAAGSDDEVWAQRTIAMSGGTAPEDSTSWNDLFLATGGNVTYEDGSWTTPGYIYQRVFEGTPANGSWFYESSLEALITTFTPGGGATAPNELWLGSASSGWQATQQVSMIPEPATMGLLGFGALVMAIRRRRS